MEEQIRELRARGLSVSAIARQLRLDRKRVREALPEWQVTVDLMRQLHEEGLSPSVIAERTGVPLQTVCSTLRVPSDGNVHRIGHLWDLGHDVPTIAAQTGESPRRVLAVLRKLRKIQSTEAEIARLRAEALTREEVARRLGVTPAYVSMVSARLRAEGRMDEPVRPWRVTDEQVLEAHSRGSSVRQMAKELGISPASVRYRLRRLRLEPNLPPHLPRGETRIKVEELAAQGLSRGEIAKRMGVSRQRINQLLAHRPDPDLAAEVRRMRSEGMEWADIARQLNIHPARAWWLYQRGA